MTQEYKLKKLAKISSMLGVLAAGSISLLGAPKPASAQLRCIDPTPQLPPVNCAYAATVHQRYNFGFQTWRLRSPFHRRFIDIVVIEDPSEDPGPSFLTDGANSEADDFFTEFITPGETQFREFNSLVDVIVDIESSEGETTLELTDLEAIVRTRVTLDSFDIDAEEKRVTNEILALDIDLPNGFIFREDPERESVGQSIISRLDDGNFEIQSFFTIFSQISPDGGATYVDVDLPSRVDAVGLVPEPLPILGSLATLGLGILLKQRQGSRKRKGEQ